MSGRRLYLRTAWFLLAIVVLAACGPEAIKVETWTDDELGKIRSRVWRPATALDPTNRVSNNAEAQAFGELLFFSSELSLDRTISCATCHDPELGFSDGEPVSQGLGETRRHSPQLWNVGFQRWFYWDGRRDSLWSQALSPIEDPSEMGLDRLNVLRRVKSEPTLSEYYRTLFGEFPAVLESELISASPLGQDDQMGWLENWVTLTEEEQFEVNYAFANIGKAIAAYEMTLVSGESRFDTYARAVLAGDAEAQQSYSAQERLGLRLFIGKARCFFCHTGPRFTDDEFHNLGFSSIEDLGRISAVEEVKSHPFNALGAFSDDNAGESAQFTTYLTLSQEQAGQFKTGGLRNIESSPPYMHDGRFETLREVVEFYSLLPGRVEVGHREDFMVPLLLSDQELDALVAFLKSLAPL